MPAPPRGSDWPDVGAVVEAFESALARGDDAEVADYTPSPDHPDRLEILCELVRVDLEHRWQGGRPRPLDDYRRLDPALFDDPDSLRAMAFEEYRLRLQAGEATSPAEYRARYRLDTGDWPAPAEPQPSSSRGAGPLASRRGPRSEAVERLERRLDVHLSSGRLPAVSAEMLRSIDQADPHAAERISAALAGLPPVGSDFLGFHLCGELGRGAFGRVYLARQTDLADRPVALKVSADVAGESHALARLQHTNVVPIHSVHRRGALQAVCMPYLGATTLADTIASIRTQASLPGSGAGLLSSLRSRRLSETPSARPETGPATSLVPESTPGGLVGVSELPMGPQAERLRGMGYVPAVLWLVARVADGLAHAHDRGILHRDLKPANILFSDDGEPVLLDFNLAADTRGGLRAAVALVGGTLPYMAPEQLTAFQRGDAAVDVRSDLFALGVILYELLTGVHPYPVRSGAVDAILPAMIADRNGPIPDPRRVNPLVSPAVASIVRHCLEPAADRRYQSARQLQDDLVRQLENLPLRHAPEVSARERLAKWGRRHPRLTSSTTVGLVALALLTGVGSALAVRNRQYRAVEAAESLRRLSGERRQAFALLSAPEPDPGLIAEGLRLCGDAAGRYGVVDDPAWLSRPLASALPRADRDRLRRDLGDVLVLWAQALTRDASAATEALTTASSRLDRAAECYGPGTGPRALALARADVARLAGRQGEARRLRTEAAAVPLATPRERLLVEPDQLDPGIRNQLLADLGSLTEGDPQDFAVWVALGNGNARSGRSGDALAAYNVAAAMAPQVPWVRYNRGLLFLERKEFPRALDDFDSFLAARPDVPSALLNRALTKLGLGDARGGVDDLTRCLGLKKAPTRAWFIRAQARARLGDREGAAQDREAGLKATPNDPASYVARGLARLPKDVQGALADFDAALRLSPTYRHALQDRASVLSETLGRPEEALKSLDRAVETSPNFVEARAGRAVLLARLGRRAEAVRDADAAVTLDDSPLTVYQAACVYALTSKQNPDDAPRALRLLTEAASRDPSWVAVARTDRDLEPLQNRRDFQQVLKSLELVTRPEKAR